ncbi:MAG: CPBP family intramembrane metalloprotease [Candidatus Lokiarchaeota archaeon]|nr:CPBP family intramembrane metalloprotease [Candidatus Lokiarchaeota archaeon]
MKFGTKYFVITVIVICLIIPIFFGIYINFLLVSQLSSGIVLFLLIGFALLLGLGKVMEILMYSEKSKELMKQHDVVEALLDGNDLLVLLVFFPLTMIMEEFIFRYYLIGFLINQLKIDILPVILISSVVFSLYHIHIWFKFKNFKILVAYLISSFFLGIYNGYILLSLGIFACIIAHSFLVFLLYYSLYKKLS